MFLQLVRQATANSAAINAGEQAIQHDNFVGALPSHLETTHAVGGSIHAMREMRYSRTVSATSAWSSITSTRIREVAPQVFQL